MVVVVRRSRGSVWDDEGGRRSPCYHKSRVDFCERIYISTKRELEDDSYAPLGTFDVVIRTRSNAGRRLKGREKKVRASHSELMVCVCGRDVRWVVDDGGGARTSRRY